MGTLNYRAVDDWIDRTKSR